MATLIGRALYWPPVLGPALLLALFGADGSDRPYVQILASSGAVDGPAEGGIVAPRWEQVRIELKVENRLEAEVHDLELEVALVSAGGTEAIPGWTFKELVNEAPLLAEDTTYLKIQRELPARRSSPPADEIAYRVRILSYRVTPPDLETALRLLGSAAESDQRAALRSFEKVEGDDPEALAKVADELGLALSALPLSQGPSEALRLLLAIRALGSVGSTRHAPLLLALPDRLDRAAWGRAVIELAQRMVAASEPEEPRLRVLPSWAREPSALLTVRAQDAIEDAVRDAVLRMGDPAVPALLEAAHTPGPPERQARAERLLHSLGRGTVRSQLSIQDREARLLVINVLGQLGGPAAVPNLAELLRSRDQEQREAAMSALLALGAAAIDPLVDNLGGPDDRAVLETLGRLGQDHPQAVRQAALRFGVAAEPKEELGTLLARLFDRLRTARRAKLVAQIDRALELGREGSYTEAFAQLDQVFSQDPALYGSYAVPIADLYMSRARRLYASGDYEAAVLTLRTGLGVHRTEAARRLLRDAQLALARGFLELGDLERATSALAELDPDQSDQDARLLEARLLSLRAAQAMEAGDQGKARTLLDRARALNPFDTELVLLDRRLALRENVAILAVLGLSLPALVLVLVLSVRRRIEKAKLLRLERAIDRS